MNHTLYPCKLVKVIFLDFFSVINHYFGLILISIAHLGTIDANTIWGAMWGLETLSQTITYNGSYWFTELPISISDRPRYPWR